MTKMYNIVDMQGNYYKIGAKGNLVVVRTSDEADLFTIREANSRIGGGKKAKFYTTVEAEMQPAIGPEETYSAPEFDEVEKPTLFDGLDNDWETTLSKLCYMSSHILEYQNNLNSMLSDVDKEVCDLLHFLEFNELDEPDMLKASKMLQDARRRRREIKDEIEKTALMRATFLDKEFEVKVHQSLKQMEYMKYRRYTPRKLTELFNEPIRQVV